MTIILVLTLFIAIIDKIGKSIVLLEIVAFFGCFTCLFMPVISYSFYNKDYYLARVFRVYMHVPEETYFTYALPALSAFTLAMCWPLKVNYAGSIKDFFKSKYAEISNQLRPHPYLGLQLVVVGIVMLYLSAFLPSSLRFIGILFYFSSFAGLLYIYLTPTVPYKKTLLVIIPLFTIGNALQTGMFTVVTYMSITLISFFFIGNRASFLKKILLFVTGIFLIFLLQSVKASFRKATWKDGYQGSKAVLFQELVSRQLGRNDLWTVKAFFPIYIRTNQGVNVSIVMKRIPKQQPFDGGTYLFESIASAFVPRILWPDKPEAGGAFNMEHYAGIKIRGWATNIGPIGEAYGNFAVTGGIIFMFLLGGFIRFAYRKVLKASLKMPVILLWIPVLFYQTVFSMENDTLQVLNSLIKSAFFIYLIYKIYPALFKPGASADTNKVQVTDDYTSINYNPNI